MGAPPIALPHALTDGICTPMSATSLPPAYAPSSDVPFADDTPHENDELTEELDHDEPYRF